MIETVVGRHILHADFLGNRARAFVACAHLRKNAFRPDDAERMVDTSAGAFRRIAFSPKAFIEDISQLPAVLAIDVFRINKPDCANVFARFFILRIQPAVSVPVIPGGIPLHPVCYLFLGKAVLPCVHNLRVFEEYAYFPAVFRRKPAKRHSFCFK
ncbi:MAG: hypothetical protein DELT_03113 [Desulfovibrio sp.]